MLWHDWNVLFGWNDCFVKILREHNVFCKNLNFEIYYFEGLPKRGVYGSQRLFLWLLWAMLTWRRTTSQRQQHNGDAAEVLCEQPPKNKKRGTTRNWTPIHPCDFPVYIPLNWWIECEIRNWLTRTLWR